MTVRKTKGRAIDAACGQLRRRLDRDDDRMLGLEHVPDSGRCSTAPATELESRRSGARSLVLP